MKLELALLLASGGMALLGGAAVVVLYPSRLATILAGVSLFLLGLQQLGWARAIDAISWGSRNYWLDLSLIFALPVSLAWLLLSVSLGRGDGPGRFRGWRVFVPAQAILAIVAVMGLRWFSPLGRSLIEGSAEAVPLTPFGDWVLALILLNVTLATANFESTYLALSARWKRTFRPAVLSIVIASGGYGYVIATSVLLGSLSLWGIALASIPVGFVAVTLSAALIRRRAAEASVTAPLRPIYETGSFVIGTLLLALLIVLVQVTRLTGWTLVRTAWISILCATLGGLAAVAVSSRLQRLLQRLVEPYLQSSRFDPGVVWSRLSHELDETRTPSEALRIVPSKTAEIAGVDPVTLFLRDEAGNGYVVAGSTLDPAPKERVGNHDPLVRELRASHHTLDLRGPSDDLGLIPVYVENAKQISACEAVCAAPLIHQGELLGFLLCGGAEQGRGSGVATLLQLEVIARMVTTRLTSLERGE